jgi:type IV pilus assembly protein PilV
MYLNRGSRSAQRGVGLVEVLIAVLVLSFGMLGLVGLQTWSLRNNQSALERGMATVQTHSIADAMRADRTSAMGGAYNIAIDAATPTVAANSPYRVRTIAIWRDGLRQALNSTATGSIACTGAQCEIVVRWDDSRATGVPSTTYQILTEVEL